ncbi:PD-(D/E)XK nuclease family protein [Deinococcus aestuarii]|uniref:PD-(D/E)XK nuclease family protein n=1 Tax=Deinococcus aestuarii TaxID=2774531 RepID=UPI001C0E2E52|nr:PD-(D/E)XK nuclease family protein [Deinococcus aestuarii]
MTRTLITHPSPNLLRHLAREHLTARPSLTLVPNLAAGRSLRQLTRRALPTITFAQHARRHLARAGWSPLSPAERELRLRELLTRLDLEYFGPILDRPGTVAALHQVIRALLRADAARLPGGRSPRERDLVRLHRGWVLELLRDERYDAAVPEFFASRIALEPQAVTLAGFAYLDAAQTAYLDRLAAAGSAAFLPATGVGELSEARRTAAALRGRGWTEVDGPGTGHDRDPRLSRVGDQAARAALPGTGVRAPDVPVLALPGVVEETREVLRQVKRAHQEGGLPWHDLAIVVRDEAAYLPPLLETAERYGVPLLSQARQPLLSTPLGSFLHAWVAAGLGDWAFPLTVQVLTHPLVHLPFDAEEARRAMGRRTPRGLQAWGDRAETSGLAWPEQGSGLAYLQGVTRALQTLGVLGRQRRDPHLGTALAALQQALQPLALLPVLPRAQFLGALQAALAEARVAVVPGRGGVRVATPLGTLGRSFEAVWVLGLSEGLFPQPVGDPPLLDAHLRAFWSQTGVYLPGGIESQAIEQALFFHALACARDRLTLTRPEVVGGGKLASPSPFLQAFPVGELPAEVYAGTTQEERILRARTGTLNDDRVTSAARLEEVREHGVDQGPRFPGVVNPDTWTWSASQLHAFGACRYRWFVDKVMRLGPPAQPHRGLDPLGRGSLYHLALEKLLRPFVGEPAPSPDDLARRVPSALDEAAAELVGRGEVDLGPMWHVERGDHVALLQGAVRAPDFLPAGHRVEALEQELEGHVSVEGQPWAFRGYADRVDLAATGQRIVTDYKLSSHIGRVRDQGGRLNTEVQLPVYLELTGAAVGRYFSLRRAKVLHATGPGQPSPKTSWSAAREEVQVFLRGMRADLLAGDFRAKPDPEAQACQFCDVQALCRFQTFRSGEPA